MPKFQRNYRITIDLNDGGQAIVIEPPFTIDFSIQRNSLASPNTMSLNIYNLSPATRSNIFQDRYILGTYKRIIVEAGYGDNISTIFSGAIFQASSVLRGTEVVTNITARDGFFDIANTTSYRTIEAGQTNREVISSLAGDFEFISQGEIGGVEKTINRAVVLEGNTYNNIKKYSEGDVYVDLEKMHVLSNNQVLSDAVFVLNAETGLLETPERQDTYLSVTSLFEPRIKVGQIVEIESEISPIYNGQYKAVGVTHQGTISQAVSGKLISKFSLLLGGSIFGGFSAI